MTAAPESLSPLVSPSMVEGKLELQLLTVTRESHYHLAPPLPPMRIPSCCGAGSALLATTTTLRLSLLRAAHLAQITQIKNYGTN